MEQDNNSGYVILTQDILEDKELRTTDKIVLAHISGFKSFFESARKTAEVCGLSERTVKSAKQRLIKCGYLVEIKDTGRGKVYAADVQKLHTRCADSAHQMCKTCQSDVQNEAPYNKDTIKTIYGRADINELEDLWQNEVGISIKGQAHQRQQLYNLIRKYGLEATKSLVKRVGAAKRSGNQFAPQIATPSDLTGKYSKLPKLELWEQRNKPKGPTIDYYRRGQKSSYEDIPDDKKATPEQIKQARERLFAKL